MTGTSVRRFVCRGILALGLLAVAFLAVAPSIEAAGGKTDLPLSDYLQAQGTSDVWYADEPALFAWTGRPPAYPHMGWIDYAGARLSAESGDLRLCRHQRRRDRYIYRF